MANYVKISSVGPQPFSIETGFDYQKAVKKMMRHWKNEIEQVLPDKPDLIVLPEACDRPPNYSMKKRLEYYKERNNQILEFFCETAEKNHCYIAYSAAREVDDGTYRNSTCIINRDGKVAGTYNKNHPVIEETTEGGILCGKEAPIIECDFGRVAAAICFDLNFEELRLKYAKAKPDIILFSSMYHGGLMQNYWAYSCRSHFVGCIAGLPNTIISPVGEVIASSTNYYDFITANINIDCTVAHLDHNWDRFKAMKKKYGAKVKMMDPGYLGAVLISSETKDFTVMDMVREFEIELLDVYMDRSLAHRNNLGNIEK